MKHTALGESLVTNIALIFASCYICHLHDSHLALWLSQLCQHIILMAKALMPVVMIGKNFVQSTLCIQELKL